MSVWDNYEERMEARGETRRAVALKREKRYLNTRLPDSLSYHQVQVDSTTQNVGIINSDNLYEKYIYSMPGYDIRPGAIVTWMQQHWIVTERDANSELQTRCIMIQCNHKLKWVDSDNVIHEQWCYVEDGTKLKHVIECMQRFGILETVCKNFSLLCWDTLRAMLTTTQF